MAFVGIVCDSKNEHYIRKILEKELKNKNIIVFTEENVENLKNIKFETIAILSNNYKILSKKAIVQNIISKVNYLILNADELINLNFLENMKLNVITYGFSSKSTITASSVKEDGILLCVQRNIYDVNKNEIEPQEISIKIQSKMDTNIIMGVATILLIYDKREYNL